MIVHACNIVYVLNIPEEKFCAHDSLEIGSSFNSPEMAKVPTDPSDSISKANTSK